ncbi:MAG: ABC transporter permease [Proteobacteria bacterium]|nr:ABC transporter permease [Pseudomonadota bacterium]
MNSFFEKISLFSLILVIAFYLLLLIFTLFIVDFTSFSQILFSERITYSIKLSLLSATLTSLLAMLLSIPAGYFLSRKNFPLKSFLEGILDIPFIISPVAIGVLILIVLQHKYLEAFQERFFNISFAVPGIIIAQFATVLGMSVKLTASHFDEIPERYEMVASTLGAKPLQVFIYVLLPLLKRGIFLTFILIWTKAIGEFGATFIVAGSMPFKTETLPIFIYTKLTAGEINASLSAVIIAMVISVISLCLLRIMNAKG